MKSELSGHVSTADISGIELLPGLKKNHLSYVRLERKGV
jgi:hypothetical protein